jgi:NAD(P) transhydrogenase
MAPPRSPDRFDLVVIGSGPAGEKAAAQAAYFGKRVAVVERSPEPGGASVHTGTLPSKTLRETALYLTGFRRRELYGMKVHLDRQKSLRQLVGRLKQVEEMQTRQIQRNLDRHGIEVVRGSGRLLDPRTVEVADPSGAAVRRVSGEAIVIATGSSPASPAGISMRDRDVVDSDRILDLDRVPSTMTVVGGGVIGTEYASLFAALGTRIVVVEGRDRLLAGVDEELSAAIQLSLERMGAEILLGNAVTRVERLPGRQRNGLRLSLQSGGTQRADKVLFSAGRIGNSAGLGLESVGVEVTDRGHIRVDEHFQTSVEKVYAVGDVIGFPALAATSMEQGRVAACHAFAIEYKKALAPLLPFGIYSIPEISYVGSSEQELKAKGTAYEIGRARFENNARGQITGDFDGFIKILFDPASRRLLGAHVFGEHATELVHVPLFVMQAGGTIDAFIDAVFNFPTLTEGFKYAAYDGLQRLARATGSRPAESTPRTIGPPATRPWFIGVALGARVGDQRPLVVCEMDRWRRCRFRSSTLEPTADGLLAAEVEKEGFMLSVEEDDGAAEVLSALTRRGHGVLGSAPDEHVEVAVARLASFWNAWSRGEKPSRAPGAERRRRYEALRAHGLELPVGDAAVYGDELDAAACAYAAYLWATGQAGRVGNVVKAVDTAPAMSAAAGGKRNKSVTRRPRARRS